MVEITVSAQEYLQNLLLKQESNDIGIRVFIANPGTPAAETCIAYCIIGEEQPDDIRVDYSHFPFWVDARSARFLEDASVNFVKDTMGGQLTVEAPNARTPNFSEDDPLEDRINYLLYSQINPSLASHGGMVNLVEIVEDSIAVLQFGGGCQGCGMVDVTLRNGVERSLLEQLPELTAIRDITDHSITENAYY
jgi:Fe/S biogenesis protein NfuA